MKFDTSKWPAPFQQGGERINDWLASVNPVNVILSVIVVLVVFFLRKPIAGWVFEANRSLLKQFKVSLSQEVADQLKKASEVLVVTLSLYLALDLIQPPELAGGLLRNILKSVALIAIFGAWYQLSGPFSAMLHSERHGSVRLEIDWVLRITRFAILLLGITAVLEVWEVDISAALTGVGVLGAGLAIAMQDLIRNLVAGMSNISEKRFETGDTIEVDGCFIGTVKKIDLRSTLVVGFDQIPRYIPNSDLANSVILNYTSMKHRRVLLKVPLVRSSTPQQIETVRDALRHYHRNSGDFDLSEAAPKHIYINEIASHSVDILIYALTKGSTYEELLQVTERLTLAILAIVEDAGTSLAYPTQTIQLDDRAMKMPGMRDQTPPMP